MSGNSPFDHRTINPQLLHRPINSPLLHPSPVYRTVANSENSPGTDASLSQGTPSDSTGSAYPPQPRPSSFLQTLLQQARGERPPTYQRPDIRHGGGIHQRPDAPPHLSRRLPTPPALRQPSWQPSFELFEPSPRTSNTHSDLDAQEGPSSSRQPPANTMPPARRVSKRTIPSSSESPPPSSATKRQKRTTGRRGSTTLPAEPSTSSPYETRRASGSNNTHNRGGIVDIDEIDLVNDSSPNSLADTLQKQRQEQIRAQEGRHEKPTKLSNLKCVICLDNPTDLTATLCGHLFCHTCLMEALIASENRSGPGEAKRAQCPVCRKTVRRQKATDVVPLLMMKGVPRGKGRVVGVGFSGVERGRVP